MKKRLGRGLPDGPLFHLLLSAAPVMERALPAYQIHAVGDDGQVLALATADTATLALAGLMSANQDYTRAWVVDEFNVDVTPEDLMQRAQAERGNT